MAHTQPSYRRFWIPALALGLIAFVGCSSDQATSADGGATADSGGDTQSPPTGDQGTLPDATSSVQGTGGTGGERGHTMQSLTVDGAEHIFAVHVPASYVESEPVPLLLHFHGWRPLPAGVSEELQYLWAPSSEAQNFIAVAPEGLPCPELNESDPYGCFRETRDGPFVAALIEHLGGLYNLNPERLFLSGHSGGAFFVQGHALTHPTTYVAAAAFAGGCISASDQYGNSCSVYEQLSSQAQRKIPFFVAHNADDQVVPVTYSADLISLLEENGHPIKAISDYDGGTYGHSVDASIVPEVWTWLTSF